jgi:hypothetical protein
MKLAKTTHYIACKNDLNRAGRNCPRSTRFTTSRIINIRRPLTRVVARWHVCPKTHRLECRWSLEPMACDDQLCRSRTQRRRHAWPRVRQAARLFCALDFERQFYASVISPKASTGTILTSPGWNT